MALADTADVSAKRIKPTRSPNVSSAVGDIVLPGCCERGSPKCLKRSFWTVAPDGYVKYPLISMTEPGQPENFQSTSSVKAGPVIM